MSAPRNRASGQVRIISGQWRGRKLPVLHSQGLRPTTDRTKETLFNWLMHDVRGSYCLDAFAGAGSLGFEALSRGAEGVILLEKDTKAAASLKKNTQLLQANAEVICTDTLTYLQQCTAHFNLVFLDPPFHAELLMPCLETILERELLTAGALVYMEHEASLTLPAWPNLQLQKQKQTAQFRYALYKYLVV